MMPEMDGMEFLKKIQSNQHLQNIPVIMQTAAAEKEQIVEGIEAGVYYYLTKPYSKDVLNALIKSALSNYQNKQLSDKVSSESYKVLSLLKNGYFEISTIEDAQNLALSLSTVFPDPEKVVFGLSEMLTNAIEHGNLGIGFKRKEELVLNNEWEKTVNDLQKLPENKNKVVRVDYVRNKDNICIVIEDEGDGFDWKEYTQIGPDSFTDKFNGRGIALSRMFSFDDISYVGRGNKVRCVVDLNK